MALEFLSSLYTFKNSTKCDEISFDPHSFLEWLKGLFSPLLVDPICTGKFFTYFVLGGVFAPSFSPILRESYSYCSLDNWLSNYNNDNELVTFFVARQPKNKGKLPTFYLLNKENSI